MNSSRLALSIVLLGCSLFAFADRIDTRQENQDARIEKGVASGKLTEKETARLQAGQERIDAAEARAESDGNVTGAEKRRLERMQDRQNRRIFRGKRNGR